MGMPGPIVAPAVRGWGQCQVLPVPGLVAVPAVPVPGGAPAGCGRCRPRRRIKGPRGPGRAHSGGGGGGRGERRHRHHHGESRSRSLLLPPGPAVPARSAPALAEPAAAAPGAWNRHRHRGLRGPRRGRGCPGGAAGAAGVPGLVLPVTLRPARTPHVFVPPPRLHPLTCPHPLPAAPCPPPAVPAVRLCSPRCPRCPSPVSVLQWGRGPGSCRRHWGCRAQTGSLPWGHPGSGSPVSLCPSLSSSPAARLSPGTRDWPRPRSAGRGCGCLVGCSGPPHLSCPHGGTGNV